MCRLKLRKVPEVVFYGRLKTSFALPFHLNLESYISCYLLGFHRHLIM